jgi:hypothetical protein
MASLSFFRGSHVALHDDRGSKLQLTRDEKKPEKSRKSRKLYKKKNELLKKTN